MLFGNKKERARNNAEKYIAQGKYAAAIEEYESIVRTDPSDMMAVNTLGDLYTRAGKLDEAVHNFMRIAEGYRESGFTLKAIAMYKKISKLKPNDFDIIEKLAGLYTQQGLMVEARKQYLSVAENYLASGNTGAVYPIYKKIVDLEPDNYEVRIKLAEVCVRNGDSRQAHDAFLHAGQELFRRGMFRESIEAFLRALEQLPNSVSAINAATRVYAHIGQIDKAIELLNRAFASDPENQQLKMLLATVYMTAGMVVEAENTLLGIVSVDPSKYELFLELGRKCLEKNMLDLAAQQAGNAIEHLLNFRTEDKGIALLHEILKRDKNHLLAIERLLEIYTRTGDIHSLISTLDWYAEAATRKGDRDRAIEALKRLIELDYNNPDYLHRLEKLGVDLSSTGTIARATPDEIVVSGSDIETFDQSYQFETQGQEEEIIAAEEFESLSLQTELDNVDFFIAQNFVDIARDNLYRLKEHFGPLPEILERERRCGGVTIEQPPEPELIPAPEVNIIEESAPEGAISGRKSSSPEFTPFGAPVQHLGDMLAPAGNEFEFTSQTLETPRSFNGASQPRANTAAPLTAPAQEPRFSNTSDSNTGFAFTFFEEPSETEVSELSESEVIQNPDLSLFGSSFTQPGGQMFDSTSPVQLGTAPAPPPEPAAGDAEASVAGAGFEFTFAPAEPSMKVGSSADAFRTSANTAYSVSPGGSNGSGHDGGDSLETLEIDLEELDLGDILASGYDSGSEREAAQASYSTVVEPMSEPPRISMRPVNSTPSIVPAKPARDAAPPLGGHRTVDIKCLDPISNHAGILRIQTCDGVSNLFDFNPTEEESATGIDPQLAEVYDEVREALGAAGAQDFETAYQLGQAYKEMELWDKSIKEFQTAIRLTSTDDPTGRYLQCCAMLGACFLGKGNPRPAVLWIEKGLATPNRSEDEYQALRFDLGVAFEMMGDRPKAHNAFQEVYAIDVDYRNVASKLSELEGLNSHLQ